MGAERYSDGGAMKSCLSGKSGVQDRADAIGTRIEKGKKEHRISFVDEVHPGTSIEETHEVASHKNAHFGMRDDGSQPGCLCTVM
mmetsp:Transcript_61054/g.145467  ORF Transcript_61054/g.145467 Transcript_61054/m.145467 type:complete len:85 (+) Transcript_61054:110-364(+)|eukprot:CAMPEP_0178412308 /NCGR_PEP_ID=MMETSP0689_2-20121128/21950_1 /TAXON_ID=160604 /ORGANISM="Amphidinium massartii, Strain CS-259" /LENGTH=84 /DNA_ID=CAMNT_0020033555 /DNA_START=126 /DNA_END=380 /DNA_ORIENTATION=+